MLPYLRQTYFTNSINNLTSVLPAISNEASSAVDPTDKFQDIGVANPTPELAFNTSQLLINAINISQAQYNDQSTEANMVLLAPGLVTGHLDTTPFSAQSAAIPLTPLKFPMNQLPGLSHDIGGTNMLRTTHMDMAFLEELARAAIAQFSAIETMSNIEFGEAGHEAAATDVARDIAYSRVGLSSTLSEMLVQIVLARRRAVLYETTWSSTRKYTAMKQPILNATELFDLSTPSPPASPKPLTPSMGSPDDSQQLLQLSS